jgi:hypothetical protein
MMLLEFLPQDGFKDVFECISHLQNEKVILNLEVILFKKLLKSILATPSQVGKGLQFQTNQCNSRLTYQPQIFK